MPGIDSEDSSLFMCLNNRASERPLESHLPLLALTIPCVDIILNHRCFTCYSLTSGINQSEKSVHSDPFNANRVPDEDTLLTPKNRRCDLQPCKTRKTTRQNSVIIQNSIQER